MESDSGIAIDSKRKSRLGYIDAMRGIAALCVCLQHFSHAIINEMPAGSTQQTLLSGAVDDRFDLGRYGVVLFFLISGFVIPFSLKGDGALRRFGVSRFFRLYPAFWLAVAFVGVVAFILDGTTFSPATILANLTMVPELLGQPYVSGVFWTLYVEVVFYVACAVLFALGLLRNPHVIVLMVLGGVGLPVVGVVLNDAGTSVPIVYLTSYVAFLFTGYLLRMALEGASQLVKAYAVIAALLTVGSMPVLASQHDHLFTISTPWGVTLAGAAAVVTFTAVIIVKPSAAGWLLWLGAISYSVYLLHLPIANLVTSAISPDNFVSATAFLIIATGLTLLVATSVYRYVEAPSIALGRRLVGRRGVTPAAEVAP